MTDDTQPPLVADDQEEVDDDQDGIKSGKATGHMAYDTAELRFIGTKRDTAAQAKRDIPKGAPSGRYEVRRV